MNEKMNQLFEAAKSIQGVFTLADEGYDAGSVAAALITDKGNIYTGICIDLACGIGFCAEHAAIAEMLKHRETKIDMIVAISRKSVLPPCGRCREMMMQINYENENADVIISSDKVVKLKELIPYYWKGL